MFDLLHIFLTLVAIAAAVFGGIQWHGRRREQAHLLSQIRAQGEELIHLKERHRRGLDSMGAALWEWNVPDDKIYLSDLFLEIVGYNRQEFGTDATDFFECFHADERSELRHKFSEYLNHTTAHCSAEVRFRCKDGHYIWMHLRAVGSWDKAGRAVSLVGSFSDITSKMEAEEERDRLFNLSTDMLSVGGFDQYLNQINPAWVRVLGWSRDELMRHPFQHFIHSEDQEVCAEAWEMLKDGTPIEGLEARFRCRDGSFRWLSWGSFPYADRKLVFSVVRDITTQKRSEIQVLDYQDRLRSLSNQLSLVEDRQRRELASAIHDGLAQQLFGIRAQMVLLKYPDKVPNLESVVVEIIQILDDTMNDARSLSFELFPPVLYEVGLEAAIAWLAHNFGERTGLACTSVCEGEGSELPEDLRSMAYQCVRELLANANKHAQATSIEITLNYVDQFLTILVEDDGVGFDVRKQERPTGVAKATFGFGLFSIRERLRSVDGRMLVDSKTGQGTRIFLSFPHSDSTGDVPPMNGASFSEGNKLTDG